MKLNQKSLGDVQVGQPVIAEGTYFAKLSTEIKENSKKTGDNLFVTAKILDETLRKYGDNEEFQNRGIKITRCVSLAPTEKYDPDEAVKRLAMAVGHEGEDVERSDIEGKYCKVFIVFKPGTDAYPNDGNDISRFVKITEADGFNPPE